MFPDGWLASLTCSPGVSVENVFVFCSVDVGSMPIPNCLGAEVGWPGDPVSLSIRASDYTPLTRLRLFAVAYLNVALFLGSKFS